MPRWLNNMIYIIIAIVSMGCTMQGIKWQSRKKDKKNDKWKIFTLLNEIINANRDSRPQNNVGVILY